MKKLSKLFGPWNALVLPGVVVILMVLGGIFVVKPLVEKLLSDQSALGSERQKLTFLVNKVDQLNKLDGNLVQQRLQLINSVIPSTKDGLGGIAYLSQAAANFGLSVDSLSVSPGIISTSSAATSAATGQGSEDQGLTFQMAVSGDRDSVLNFVDLFAKPTYPIFIPRTIALSLQGQKESAVLTLAMYWKSPPTSFGGDSVPVAVLTSGEESFLEWLKKYPSKIEVGSTESSGTAVPRSSLF